MIFTVSTVKESVEVLERFVRGNLAHGVDHMVICLDAPAPEVDAAFAGHPHVSLVQAHGEWWRPKRHESLNLRQSNNAHVVRGILDVLSLGDWLFHIDADEVLLLDREALASIPAEQPNVKAQVQEAVARLDWDGTPTLFKRKLDDDELALLTVLGVIGNPNNGALFRGHLAGKSGVRPDGRAFCTIHDALGPDGEKLPVELDERLTVLHYDSPSAREFVEKWQKMAGAGVASRRGRRDRTSAAMWSLVDKDLDESVRADYLTRVFAATRLDPEEDLARLGLLEEHHLEQGTHEPEPLPPVQAEAFAAALQSVRTAEKGPFLPKRWAEQGRPMLEQLLGVAP